MINRRIERGIESAHKASLNSNFPKFHLGAAVYYKGVLLATGHNSTKTSPTQKRLNHARGFNPDDSGVINSIHAEVQCLNKIKYLDIDFSKITVYTYRELKNGTKALAKPCPACMQYIKELGIKNICYTTNGGIAEEYLD